MLKKILLSIVCLTSLSLSAYDAQQAREFYPLSMTDSKIYAKWQVDHIEKYLSLYSETQNKVGPSLKAHLAYCRGLRDAYRDMANFTAED